MKMTREARPNFWRANLPDEALAKSGPRVVTTATVVPSDGRSSRKPLRFRHFRSMCRSSAHPISLCPPRQNAPTVKRSARPESIVVGSRSSASDSRNRSNFSPIRRKIQTGGEGGIRTPGTDKRYNGFRVHRLRPLSHLSGSVHKALQICRFARKNQAAFGRGY